MRTRKIYVHYMLYKRGRMGGNTYLAQSAYKSRWVLIVEWRFHFLSDISVVVVVEVGHPHSLATLNLRFAAR